MTDLSLHFGHSGHVDALFKQIQTYFETEHEFGGGAVRGPTRGDQALVVGIYGPWGAGKTTWLRALHKRARAQAKRGGAATILVPVWFSAWRFEREPHLIIPLLKTADVAIRAEREREGLDESAREWLRGAGRMLGDIVVSLAAATSFNAGFADIGFKSTTFIETLSQRRNRREHDGELTDLRSYESIYYDLNRYLEALTGRRDPPALALTEADDTDEGDEPPSGRWWNRKSETESQASSPRPRLDLLFLIDDLDRCMPENAIKVLESIKLFLEIPGCAFVLAMDDMMIERGVLHRYRDYIVPLSPHGELDVPLPLSGAEYLEKLVHLPIRVPKPSRRQLRAFIEAEYRELLAELSTNSREILDLFATCTPLNPRKVIRAIEAFRTRHELAADARYQPVLLARLILIELFAPELHRFGQTEHGRDYLWHLQRMRGRDPGELISWIDHQLQNLPELDNAADVRQVDTLLAAREVARLTDLLRLGRTDFDPRRVADTNGELRAGPVLRYHQHLTAFEDEPATHDERVPSSAVPERAYEVAAIPVAEPSGSVHAASQPQILEHQRFAALAVSEDEWDRLRAREMLQDSLIPQTYQQELLELLRTKHEAIDIEWFEFFAPNLDDYSFGILAQRSGVVARLMSDPERVHRRSDDLRRFLTTVFTTLNPDHVRRQRKIAFGELLPGRDPIDLSQVTLAHAFVRGLEFATLTLPTQASAWVGLDLREVSVEWSPTKIDDSLALTKLGPQPGLSLPKGAGAITSIVTHVGEHIVTGGADGVVRLWSDIGELLDQRFGHNHPIVALAGEDYQRTWSLDERGVILDPSGRRRVDIDRPVLGWAPLVTDAGRFAVAVLTAHELELVVVEGDDQAEHWTSWKHEAVALSCVAAFDGYRSGVVVVGDETGALHVLAYDESQLRTAAKGSQPSRRGSLRAHDGPIVCMSAPGYELFTAGPNGQVRVWNMSDRGLEPRKSVIELPGSITALVTDARPNQATNGLLVGLDNGELHRVEFDHRHGTTSKQLLGRHETAVRSLAMLDAERFACGGERSVSVWARFGREICIFPSVSSTPMCLRAGMHEVYTLDDRRRLTCWSAGRAYRRASVDAGITRLEILEEMTGPRRCFGLGREIVHCYDDQLEVALELADHIDVGAIWSEGERLVTGDANALRWWTHEGRLESKKAHGASPVIGLADWSGNGGGILSAHRQGELLVWNEQRQVQQRLPNRGPLRELVVSPGGIVAVLTEQAKIIWRVPLQPKHLRIEASHLVADQHDKMWALGLDRKIYVIDSEGEVEEIAQTYQGRLTGIAPLADGGVVTSGADGTTWYWNEGLPIRIVASLGDQAVLSVEPGAEWPISIRRDDRPWATEWHSAQVRVPVDYDLHRLLACVTCDASRVDEPHAPSFRVPLYAYAGAYGKMWQWADQNDPRQLQLRWPEPADARARLLRALFGHVPASLEKINPRT